MDYKDVWSETYYNAIEAGFSETQATYLADKAMQKYTDDLIDRADMYMDEMRVNGTYE